MSNYSKATNFTAKDGLPTGNPSKKIVGAEFDAEFGAIQTAIATKADSDSPTFTGVPVVPTAAAGTNTTQVASTSFVKTAVTNERTATATLTNKTITGTFTGPLTGDVTGNLTGNVTGNVTGSSGSTTGNAATATKLATARTIGGVSFDGSANISLPGVNTAGNQNTSGNAATASRLAVARSISLNGDVSGSVSFDGNANVSMTTTVADDSHNHIISNVDGLQSALDLKAPLASPALTGTPTAPTASFGTNTTQLATTAFVRAALSALYPVGTIYTSTVATNPATTFGFGTWEAFGAGKVLVGQDTGDSSFDTLGETGGSKDAIVVSHTHTGTTGNQSADHTHSGTTSSDGQHSHNYSYTGTKYGAECCGGDYWAVPSVLSSTTAAGAHTHSFTTGGVSSNHTHSFTTASSGSSGAGKNLQPYIVVKMWKRTA